MVVTSAEIYSNIEGEKKEEGIETCFREILDSIKYHRIFHN